jgi:hypothetical protein
LRTCVTTCRSFERCCEFQRVLLAQTNVTERSRFGATTCVAPLWYVTPSSCSRFISAEHRYQKKREREKKKREVRTK